MGERECRRADQPFLQVGEEVEVRTTTGGEPWIVVEVAAVVVLWAALVLEVSGRAFVLVLVAACAAD